MGVGITQAPYGSRSRDALRSAIAAIKADEPLAPVTVVVPSNHVGVAARRSLAADTTGATPGVGLIGVTFSTVYRLAELVAAPTLASSGRRPVSSPMIAAAIRTVLSEEPGLFAPVADHPSTETVLVGSYRELRDMSDQASDLLESASEHAREVVRVQRTAHARLMTNWYDETDLMTAAVSAIGEGALDVLALGQVILYLPQRISLHAANMLSSIAEHGELSVIAGDTGIGRADADVERTLTRLGIDGSDRPVTEPTTSAATIVTTSDSDDEVRHAVRSVVEAVRAGTPLDRIAILYASADPYARLVQEHMRAAGIKMNGTAFAPLNARTAPRALVTFLRLGADNYRRPDVFAWLTAAPMRLAGKWLPVTAWERISRDAGVVEGRNDWDQRLLRLANELTARADAGTDDPEVADWLVERLRREAEHASRLRSFMLDIIDTLDGAAATPRRWAVQAKWACERLDLLLGDEHDRNRWPLIEQNAAEKLGRALDRLAALDDVEGPVSLDVFTRTLMLELESDLGRVGRLGEGVFVGSVRMGVGLDLDLVIMLGLAEGSAPGVVREDSLLPDDDREATNGELTLRRDRVNSDHREFLASMASAKRQILCVPRGDLRRSSRRVPSRWVLDVASELAGNRMWSEDLLEASETDWLTHIPSFDGGLRRLEQPSSPQEYRLRSMLAGEATTDALAQSSLDVLRARRGSDFSRFDGNVAGFTIPSPANDVTSPTRLESFAKCPFGYFTRNILRADQIENPEDELQITPADKGTLMHNALEEFILEVLARACR